MTTWNETVEQVRSRIAPYRSEGIGESNTKVSIINPVLRGLGWNVEDLDEVRLEFKRRPADKPVDYALLIDKTPRLFVEAKALDENLTDRRWSDQIMGYATVAGVKWVVLTNGDEWRIFNSHAAVPVEDKLFRSVRISTDDDEVVSETLGLLSRESISRMEDLWREDFVDRQVRDALGWLFGPEGEPSLVRAVRKAIPSLTPGQIKAALGRISLSIGGPTPTVRPPAEVPSPEPPNRPAPDGRDTPARYDVTLAQLIAAGLIVPPLDLERRYKGRELRARVERSGDVTFDGATYRSLSVAGGVARATVIGAPVGRAYHQTNGWTFWRYRTPDGALKEIDEIRQRFLVR